MKIRVYNNYLFLFFSFLPRFFGESMFTNYEVSAGGETQKRKGFRNSDKNFELSV